MKSSLLLPLKYILTVIILLVLFTLFKLFPIWGNTFIPGAGMAYTNTREILPILVADVFLLAATLASFIAFMGIRLERGGRFLKLILMLCASFFVLSVGFSLTTRYLPPDQTPASTEPVLIQESLNPLTHSYLYPQRVENGTISGIVVFDRIESGFTFYRNGKIDQKGNLVPSTGGRTLRIDPPNPGFSSLFRQPKFLHDFSEDLAFFTGKLQAIKNDSRNTFLFYCFVISLFCASCGTIARISRWPVFNIIALIAMFRALFYLFRVFSSESGTELAGFISERVDTAQLPLTILLLIAGVLLIWDMLFIRGQKKKGRRRYG